jgi:hypothetical protein
MDLAECKIAPNSRTHALTHALTHVHDPLRYHCTVRYLSKFATVYEVTICVEWMSDAV